MPMQFSKCGKKAKDLLKKGYEDKRKVTLTTKTPTGIKFKTTGELKGKGSHKGTFEASYKHPSGFHLDKLSVGSAHELACEISLNEQAEGVKFYLKTKIKDLLKYAEGESSVVGVEYANKEMDLFMTAEADPFKSSALVDLMVGYEGFQIGGAIAGSMKPAAATPMEYLDTCEMALGYKMGKDAEMAMKAKMKPGKAPIGLSFGILHKYSKDLSFATTVDHSLFGDSADVAIKAGGKYCLDPETTFQAMVDGKALLSLSYAQKLRPMVKLTSSAKVDMTFVNDAYMGGSSPTSFGFALELGDV